VVGWRTSLFLHLVQVAAVSPAHFWQVEWPSFASSSHLRMEQEGSSQASQSSVYLNGSGRQCSGHIAYMNSGESTHSSR
jgi:hypothetical protein